MINKSITLADLLRHESETIRRLAKSILRERLEEIKDKGLFCKKCEEEMYENNETLK